MSTRNDTTKLVNELNESKFFAKRLPAQSNNKSGLAESPLFPKEIPKDSSKDKAKDNPKDESKEKTKELFKDLQLARQNNPNLPTADDVERMVFEYRKADKTRFNGDVPQEWKEELDAYADRIDVGKYNMIMYAVGKFLGKL